MAHRAMSCTTVSLAAVFGMALTTAWTRPPAQADDDPGAGCLQAAGAEVAEPAQ